MPTYEYECRDCGEKFEVFQKMTDEPVTVCPRCKGKVKKLISTGCGLIFKGSGFYITDYKRKKPSPSGEKTAGNCDCSCASCPDKKDRNKAKDTTTGSTTKKD